MGGPLPRRVRLWAWWHARHGWVATAAPLRVSDQGQAMGIHGKCLGCGRERSW